MITRDLLTGYWKPYLEHALTLKPYYDGHINGGEVSCIFFICLSYSVIQHSALYPYYVDTVSRNLDIILFITDSCSHITRHCCWEEVYF
jgi:hypothetical protein